MKISNEYSHFGGSEILQIRYPEINRNIDEVIFGIDPGIVKNGSEINENNEGLPDELVLKFREAFRAKSFVEIIEKAENDLNIPNHAFEEPLKQIAFIRENTFVNIELAPFTNSYNVLAKLLYLFDTSKATVGVEIIFGWDFLRITKGIEILWRNYLVGSVKVIFIDAGHLNFLFDDPLKIM